MISDTPRTPSPSQGGTPQDDFQRSKERGNQEFQSAKSEAANAADTARGAASDLSRKAQEKAYEQGEKGKETVTGGLDDFAAAVRKASDELGSRDQSMASQLVREVAGGLEQASKTIHGKDVGELAQSVARFARQRPATFLVGAALAGLALGRFARSSGEHDANDYAGGYGSNGSDRYAPSQGSSRTPGSGTVPSDYRSTYTDQPRPVEGAYPTDRDPVTGAPRPRGGVAGASYPAPRDTLAAANKPTPTTTSSTTPVTPRVDPILGDKK